ncbi:hypothetical protein PF005_g24973 [Phytophthora fragariae]|uniref:SCP domain-containing protein n=1 Tax=Phytophthora fragariae TaxID=53985 RepID=A0A6A3W4R0_9STRA|nr:hypothetical protein PF003_g21463 [Phytophthora fragariae]KAE8923513.1 hypothetical protein PF009_g26238 [Phytophthora fragariae]KAE8969958.1 hypothetical protein PF011_g26601 [Phytophthora fragariae]KAE9068098.1 hypothetical protein PF010_g27199 [Phytophthora fragariae]KAE9075530.1 hypothetical protein PF007_g24971 [Phytophthora fragariae]
MVALAQTSIVLLLVVASISDAANLRQDQHDSSAMAQENQFSTALLVRVNKERAAHGLAPVCSNKKLQAAAERHVQDQSKTDYVSDTGTDDSTPETRVTDAGYKWQSVRETIGAGNANADDMVDWWMKTASREIVLGKFTMAGSAYAYNANTYSKHYWVQVFGTGSSEACDA